MFLSPSSIPESQTAILTGADGSLVVTPALPIPPISPISPTSVLVRTRAIALNPSDHKMPARLRTPGLLAGCDFAGVIVALGSDVHAIERPGCKAWALGDRVCGAVHGCNALHPRIGSFAQYVEADPVVLVRIAERWDWVEGAALGGSCVGATGLALYREMRLKWPREGEKERRDGDADGHEQGSPGLDELRRTVLVYGGSTACGTMAIQLLRLSGYIPITTCSPHNNTLVASYGAAATFDYRSPTCAHDIKAHTKNSLRFALDCIGTAQSTALCYAALGRTGGRYVALERYPESVASRKTVRGSWVLGPVMFGRRIEMEGYNMDADAEAREFGREWYAGVERLAREGRIKVHPVRKTGKEGDWAIAVLEGLEMLRNGEVSGEKLVVEVGGQV